MPRPKSDTALTRAERGKLFRDRRADRGDVPWRPDLSQATRAKAEREAAARGISPAAAVDAMVAEARE